MMVANHRPPFPGTTGPSPIRTNNYTPNTTMEDDSFSNSSSYEDLYDTLYGSRSIGSNTPTTTTTTTTTTTAADKTTQEDCCVTSGRCVNSCTAYGRVCPHNAKMAAAYAHNALEELKQDSLLFSSSTSTTTSPAPPPLHDENHNNSNNNEQPPQGEHTSSGDSSSSESSSADTCSVAERGCCAAAATGGEGEEELSSIERFDPDLDIERGVKLGEGGFSLVHCCTVTKSGSPCRNRTLAMKFLKRKIMVDLHPFKHGAADLITEAYFLQTLSHDHIIKLHGISSGNMEDTVTSCGGAPGGGGGGQFFLVLDRLADTLEKRLAVWRKNEDRGNVLTRRTAEYKEKKRLELKQRIRIASEIATAVEYLHSKRVVYRDLKPDNIGFDQDGVLKLFDFGLAKELKPKDRVRKDHDDYQGDGVDGRYNLTGNTGSRRYMAPEVAQERPYDASVDSYSFGIMLWELCTATKPFYGYSSNKHMQLVVLGGERPPTDPHHHHHHNNNNNNDCCPAAAFWPPNLPWLLHQCWSENPRVRPSFAVIKRTLFDILQEKEDIPQEALRLLVVGANNSMSGGSSTNSGGGGSTSTEEMTSASMAAKDDFHLDPPSTGFSALFKNGLHKVRFKSTGDAPEHGAAAAAAGGGTGSESSSASSSTLSILRNLKRPKPHLGNGHRSSSRLWGLGSLRR